MLNSTASKPPLACDNCGKHDVQIRHVTRSYGKGATLLMIENVPVLACPHCGESYMTAETAHEITRIKLHRKSLTVKRQVSVAAFA